jgi:hypothetical protein
MSDLKWHIANVIDAAVSAANTSFLHRLGE